MNSLSIAKFVAATAGVAYLALLGGKSCVSYNLDQTQQAVVTKFGEIQRVDQKPGIHLKDPVQTANGFTKQLLQYRSAPHPAVTKDKKNIVLEFYAMYRITNLVLFREQVITESAAPQYVDDFVYSAIRNEIGKNYDFGGVITNGDEIAKNAEAIVQPQMTERGMELVDIQLTTTNPTPGEVTDAIYGRIRAERGQIAQNFTSEGEKTKRITVSATDREVVEIVSGAQRKAEGIKGEGENAALKIIQDAYGQNREFAFYTRWLQSLGDIVGSDDQVIVTTNGQVFGLFKESGLESMLKK